MDQKNSTSFRIIGAVIAVIAIAALIFFGGIQYQKSKSSITEKYLQEQVDKALTEANRWEEKYNMSIEEKTELVLKVDSLNFRLKELKKSYDQKITVVSSYTNPELERFFAERYGD